MPRCKNCKELFEKKYPNQMGELRYCLLKDECTEAFWEAVRIKRIKDAEKQKREWYEENETVQDLMKKAQKIFNEYIRLRDVGKNCISCGKNIKGKVDAGHFYSSGGHKAVTFNEDNVHAQCVYCNQYLHGNLEPYREELIKRIGKERFLELRAKSQQTANYTREELKQLIEEYKAKVKELKK